MHHYLPTHDKISPNLIYSDVYCVSSLFIGVNHLNVQLPHTISYSDDHYGVYMYLDMLAFIIFQFFANFRV